MSTKVYKTKRKSPISFFKSKNDFEIRDPMLDKYIFFLIVNLEVTEDHLEKLEKNLLT